MIWSKESRLPQDTLATSLVLYSIPTISHRNRLLEWMQKAWSVPLCLPFWQWGLVHLSKAFQYSYLIHTLDPYVWRRRDTVWKGWSRPSDHVLRDGAYTAMHIYHDQAGPALHWWDHKVYIGFGYIFGHTSPRPFLCPGVHCFVFLSFICLCFENKVIQKSCENVYIHMPDFVSLLQFVCLSCLHLLCMWNWWAVP